MKLKLHDPMNENGKLHFQDLN